MQKIALTTTFISILLCAFSACLKSEGTDKTPDDTKVVEASEKAEKSKPKEVVKEPVVEPPKPIVRNFAPPLQLVPPTREKWLASLPSEPVGTLSGEIYGENLSVFGILRASCGEGTVLQYAFKDAKNKMRVSPPMPLRFHGLATKKEVAYEEGGFAVSINFETDDGKKLKGKMSIAYVENGTKKTYVAATLDGPIAPYLFEPKLEGKGKVPSYEWCAPNGYFRLEDKKGKVTTGLLHVSSIGDTNVPQARILLSHEDGIDIATIPMSKDETIENATVDMTTGRKKGKNPAVVLADLWRLAPISTPEAATGKTLHRRDETKLLSGTAIVNLVKRRKGWELEYTLSDASFSTLIDGPLSGYEVKELKVIGWPSESNKMTAAMPPKPEWYP